ncbi:DoxX family protein [Corynebacterium halotolerans]|uniref:DoxX family protein n=1 Tax=Corynebacterium halotolerans YIM 70093 = DSM 44683 TaxID=1121362 RepID=M1NVF2_9CORY|nr:DoxX family protein [Corynebacterium halotolerans]AGF71465.1 hypothetical protein A605_02255 [Corynebacterium halotolerans YIM 70093 = DSM 44683]
MTVFNDIAKLIVRIILGVILIAHGWDKFGITGLEGITGFFDSIGVPAAGLAAPVVAVVEILGGVLLILGAATRITGVVVALLMLGAALFAHMGAGIFVANGGWELVGAIGAGFLALAAAGAGRYSVDALIARRREQPQTAREPQTV